MKFWVFVVTQKKENGQNILAREILETRLEDGFWGLGERTPNRKKLQSGDKIVFYEGNPTKAFVASATLKSSSFQLSTDDRKRFSHGRDIFTTEYGVYLDDAHLFDTPIPTDELVETLSFIENKEYWYSYFQGGTREIFEKDYITITGSRPTTLTSQIRATEDLQSESQFALEAHLEEFMFNNWERIDFGEKLFLYTDEEQNGRQYPAETWSIDFLCLDENSDFVVIELKRGKTSDAVVGQVLRYIGWVKENLASSGQKVRGIIITHEIDDALRYSAGSLQDVRVMTYRVDFRLLG
jgi:predicted RNA-binding protein